MLLVLCSDWEWYSCVLCLYEDGYVEIGVLVVVEIECCMVVVKCSFICVVLIVMLDEIGKVVI